MTSPANAVRGLLWILLGLLLALSVAFANVALTVAFLTNPGFGLDPTSRALLGLAFVDIPIAAVIVTVPALRPLYDERREAATGLRSASRGALWSALAAGACAGILFGTGLLLGLVRLGGIPYLFAHGAHIAAGVLFTLATGLFLSLALRDVGPSDANFLAGGALALGAMSSLVSVLRFDVGLAPYLLSLGSLVLWVLAYSGTIFFIGRRTAKGGQSSPVA